MKGPSIDLVTRQLDIAIARSEYRRIKFFIVALLLGLVTMFFNFFVVEGTTSFFKHSTTKYFVVGWFVVFLFYEVVGFYIAKNFLLRKEVVPGFMKIGNAFIEASFPSVLLVILIHLETSAIFLDSPLIFFYFVLIVISCLSLELRLVIIVGAVSAIGYLIITIWSINTFEQDNTMLHFPPVLYIARSLFMLIGAAGAMFVTNETKRRTLQSIRFTQQKNEIEMLFGQQVSKKVVDALISDHEVTDKRQATVLFMDIRKFSSFVEAKGPTEIIAFQNKIFSPIIRIINEHGGITNQILGDGLMATFGAPIEDAEHALHAVNAGRAILQKIHDMGTSGTIPHTKIGIGIHTGEIVMGNIGNEIRKQFSISGNTVIIAARLEQANKDYGTQFLVSEEVCVNARIPEDQRRDIGEIQVKNISTYIRVHELT